MSGGCSQRGISVTDRWQDQPWLPEDHEHLPRRVRDNEESIRDNHDSIAYLREDMNSIKSWLKAGVWGIWLLVVQVVAEWIGGGIF